MKTFMTCKEGYEKVLLREAEWRGLSCAGSGPGWVLTGTAQENSRGSFSELCFACNIFEGAVFCSAPSLNSFTEKLLSLFLSHLGERRVTDPWFFFFIASGEDQLFRHALTVKARWTDSLRKKMSRVAQLGQENAPREGAFSPGFFVSLTGFHEAYVSFSALSQGQRRMKMDPQAPSRSYLKIEEALHIMGVSPQSGEIVVDLGAAPGGWSHAALKRGARVIAVDNGPLREPVRSHRALKHLHSDALKYQHEGAGPVDWLFCDVLETPEVILEVLSHWIGEKRCRRFVVNLKLGRRDPLQVLTALQAPKGGIASFCQHFSARQLYHDRDEITLMGTVKGQG